MANGAGALGREAFQRKWEQSGAGGSEQHTQSLPRAPWPSLAPGQEALLR